MRFVRPAVFLIGKTVVQNEGVWAWLRFLGVSEQSIEKYEKQAPEKTEGEKLIELAGRRCYMSFEVNKDLNPNIKQIRESIKEYIENILASKHGSVLAHVNYTFAIENVSRVFTGEMNRHAVGTAISEGSMRFIRFNDIPIVEVPSIRLTEEEKQYVDGEGNTAHLAQNQNPLSLWKRYETRKIIERAVKAIEGFYVELVRTWTEILEGREFAGKKHITSMLRRVIPMGVATGGVWTFNIRALRHMLTMRGAEAAEEEICDVAVIILEIMMKAEPILFGDFGKDEKGFYQPKFMKV